MKSLPMSGVHGFDCARTCRMAGETVCRFNTIFAFIGATVEVNSQTVQVKVDYKNHEALAAAVKHLGGSVLGEGTHQLYETKEQGFGFKLPNWRFPCVITKTGEMKYDDYHGSWGNVKDLDKLRGAYTIAGARLGAEAMGWQTEMEGDALIIHHPSGGRLRVDETCKIDATDFIGGLCHEAITALNLPLADVTNKAEFSQSQQKIQDGQG